MRVVIVILLTAACSRPPAQEPTEPVPDEDLAPQAVATESVEPTTAEAPSAAPVLTREGLDAVLDQGPGAFLTRVEVRPHFEGKRFAGWELVAFIDDGSDMARSGLLPGDVVKTVNKHSLERPENLHKLWQNLRAAEAIVVSGIRAGKPFQLRFAVSPGA